VDKFIKAARTERYDKYKKGDLYIEVQCTKVYGNRYYQHSFHKLVFSYPTGALLNVVRPTNLPIPGPGY